MSEDLRRDIARPKLERLQAPRSKWAPGSWAKAAAYNATKPEVRCPVVIGRDSIFRTPEDLRDLCQLSSVPQVIQTIETVLTFLPEEEPEDKSQEKETLDVADISQGEYLDLKNVTEGETIVVWFHGQKRFAWLARAQRAPSPQEPSPYADIDLTLPDNDNA
ncbi:hypothetical protein P885DRAFT_77754 [Corynascus similis CBS 632.67]